MVNNGKEANSFGCGAELLGDGIDANVKVEERNLPRSGRANQGHAVAGPTLGIARSTYFVAITTGYESR